MPRRGHFSPIVSGDQGFVTGTSGHAVDWERPGNVKDLKRHLLCLNQADGKVPWERTVPSFVEEDASPGQITQHGDASSTPAADETDLNVIPAAGRECVLLRSTPLCISFELTNGKTNRRMPAFDASALPRLYVRLKTGFPPAGSPRRERLGRASCLLVRDSRQKPRSRDRALRKPARSRGRSTSAVDRTTTGRRFGFLVCFGRDEPWNPVPGCSLTLRGPR